MSVALLRGGSGKRCEKESTNADHVDQYIQNLYIQHVDVAYSVL